jgi:hypothetical protein
MAPIHFDPSYLRDLGVSNSYTLVPPGFLSPGNLTSLDACLPLDLTTPIHVGSSDLQALGVSNSYTVVPPKVLSSETSNLLTRIPQEINDQDILRVFSDVALSLTTNLLKCSRSGFVDLSPPAPLSDGQSQITLDF